MFPRSNQAIDINQWDISLLTFVLLNVFRGSFNSPGKAAVKTLRNKRNNIIGHKSDSKITNVEFASIWLHLTMAMRELCRMLAPEDQIEYISIESKIYSQPFQTATIKELEVIELTDTFTQSIIDHIMPKIKEEIVNEDVLRRLENLEKEKDIQGRQIALLAKMHVNTGCASSKRQVQEHILEASNNIISKDVKISEDEVESAVEDLFKGLEEQGVKVKTAEKGSILLTILCPTIRCLRDILDYMKSPQIKHKFTHIENAVDKYHTCKTKITVDIDLHSLETTVNSLEKELDAGAVYLTLECSGTLGVKNALLMFENGESTNTLNKLSEALSRKVGEKVELLTRIDKDKLEDEIEKIRYYCIFYEDKLLLHCDF